MHRLEVTGFGPFRERQVVDFDAFAEPFRQQFGYALR